MNERLSAGLEAVRRQSFWLVLSGTTLLLVMLAAWIGRDALDRAEEWRERGAATARAEALAATWARRLESPTAAESRAWSASAAAVDERGIAVRDRVALMQALAEQAETLGIRDAVLNFVAADTLDMLVGRELEGTVFEPAPFALALSGTMSTATLVRLIQALPPQVEPVEVDAVAVPEGVEARLLMLVFLGGDGEG